MYALQPQTLVFGTGFVLPLTLKSRFSTYFSLSPNLAYFSSSTNAIERGQMSLENDVLVYLMTRNKINNFLSSWYRSPIKVSQPTQKPGHLEQKNSTQLFTTGFVEIFDAFPLLSSIRPDTGKNLSYLSSNSFKRYLVT